MKHILSSVFSFCICVIIIAMIGYGLLCIFSEAEPWTPTAQILQFFKGVGIIALCFGVVAITDDIGGKK